MLKTCKSCTAELPDQANFCPACGTTTDSASVSAKAARSGLSAKHHALLASVGLLALLISLIYYYNGFIKPLEGKEAATHQNAGHQHAAASSPQSDNASVSRNPNPPSQDIIDQAAKQLKQNPQSAALNAKMGNLLFDSNKFDQAIPYYQEALKTDSNNTDVQVDLGVCYFNLRQYSKADTQFQIALKKDPSHINALYNSGVVALQAGNVQQLIQYWGKLIKTAPNSKQAQQASKYLESIHENIKQFSKPDAG